MGRLVLRFHSRAGLPNNDVLARLRLLGEAAVQVSRQGQVHVAVSRLEGPCQTPNCDDLECFEQFTCVSIPDFPFVLARGSHLGIGESTHHSTTVWTPAPERTLSVCSVHCSMTLPVSMFHNLTAPSELLLAAVLPSGDNSFTLSSLSSHSSPTCVLFGKSQTRNEPSHA